MLKESFIGKAIIGALTAVGLTSSEPDYLYKDDYSSAYLVSQAGNCAILGLKTDVPILRAVWDAEKGDAYIHVTTYRDYSPILSWGGCRRTDEHISPEVLFMPGKYFRESFERDFGKNRVADMEQAVRSLQIEHGLKPRL